MNKAWKYGPAWALLAGLLVLGFATVPALAQDEDDGGDLEALLEDVGEQYARGYLAPLVTGMGANQNSGLFHTAAIPGTRLTVSFGLKAMGTKLEDEDKTFQTAERVTLDERYGIDPGDPRYGEEGTLVMSGPSVFGSEDDTGTITAYYAGLPIYSAEGIESLVDLDYVPLVMPQASVGGVMGLQATVRWLPDIDAGDIGKIKLWGFGLSASANYWLPMLPVDVSVGFFKQSLDVGEYVATDAQSMYLAASRSFALATVYGAYSKEESSMDVAYTYTYDDDGTDVEEEVNFSVDGIQDSRLTVGATLNLGLKLNAEAGFGDVTTYSAGLIFGF
ncbi:MAG: hypothetical protein IPM94_13710 [bacterium]|nr:hypothetical protein [bacterium]